MTPSESTPPPYDLKRLKWMDPNSADRFRRRELELSTGENGVDLLDDIARLSDLLFDDLAVFGQSSETTSRGAEADPRLEVDVSSIRDRLVRARDELASSYGALRVVRENFIAQQLAAAQSTHTNMPIRLHIGSGGHRLDGWVNLDAGGDDLALNVNWGLPFPDGSVAFVYAAHLLEHLRFRDQAPILLAEMLRVLEPGGTARFVVPDVGRLLEAYVSKDTAFFAARNRFYPLSDGFVMDQVATLDYILLFCGADSQTMNFNHKFGYDKITLPKLLIDAGFREVTASAYQASSHPELRIDDYGYNASTTNEENEHFSLFVEASKSRTPEPASSSATV